MFDGLRFAAYRSAIGAATLLAFRAQRVPPLVPPVPNHPSAVPFRESFPQMPIADLVDPRDLPHDDDARLRRVDASARLLGLMAAIAPATVAAVPSREADWVGAVYTRLLRRSWPLAPRLPDDLRPRRPGEAVDVLARLAVKGPFASYLRADPDEAGSYVLDVSWMLGYPVRPGLLPPGGVALLHSSPDGLRTVRISRGDGQHPGVEPSRWRGRVLERDALLAGLNEDLTTFRHNVGVHLAVMTPFAVATARCLGVDHPVRRLLHHCFHTVLVGNRELGKLQLGGPRAFAPRIFSHDHDTIARMANDYLARFDFWDFESPQQFSARGTATTAFPYPYRDNVMQMWQATSSYAARFLDLYLAPSAPTQDPELRRWLDELDRLLPNGIRRTGVDSDRSWLARVCAVVIHLSTVEHDVLNNLTWDYSTPSWVVPTVVPLNGERMDRRRSFDLVATLIGTWKPYTMLLQADIPSLAPDQRGADVMRVWLDEMRAIDAGMRADGEDGGLTYPANLNVSVSN